MIYNVPLLKTVTTDLPMFATENIEGYICTEQDYGVECFALRIKDDSMSAFRIRVGDIVIVKKTQVIESGEIVVAIAGNEEMTINRLEYFENKILLSPKSYDFKKYEPRFFDKDDVQIIGKVVENRISYINYSYKSLREMKEKRNGEATM